MATLGDLFPDQPAKPKPEPDQAPQQAKPPTLGDYFPDQQAAPAPEQPPAPEPGAAAGKALGRALNPPGPWRKGYEFGEEREVPKPPGPYREGYEFPDPNAVREATWPEWAGLTATRVLPPVVTGMVTAPAMGPAAAVPTMAAGTAGEIAAQRYELSHGLRRQPSPTAAVVSGLTAGVPGLELAPETRFLPRLVMRGGEGALINVAGRTAETGVEEHRLPTLGELFPAAAGGFLFGAGAGVGEHGVIQYRGRGRAAAPETPAVGEDLGAPPPPPPGAPPGAPGVPEGVPVTPPEAGTPTGAPPAPMETVKPSEGFVGPPAPVTPVPPVDLPHTAIRDENGNPTKMYHGTPRPFENFSSENLSTDALFGPGVYLTNHPGVAGEYADSSRVTGQPMSPTDRRAHFTPGNVIDSGYVNMPPDKVLAYHETPDGQWAVTVQPVDENGDAIYGERPRMHRTDPTYPPGRASNIRPAYVDVRNPLYVDTPEGAAVYREALRASDGDKAAATAALQAQGYDGIVYNGGQRMPGGPEHAAVVAFHPDQVKDAPTLEADARGTPPIQGPLRPEEPPPLPPPPPEGPPGPPPGPDEFVGPPAPERPPEAPDIAGGPTVEEAAADQAWAAKANPFRRVPGLRTLYGEEPVPPQGARRSDRMVNAHERVDRQFADLPEASRDGLHAILDDNADAIESQVRGAQPMERTRLLARDLIFDPEIAGREPKGTTWNDQQLAAAGQHIAGLDAKLRWLTEEYKANPTPELAQEIEKTAAEQATSMVLLQARTGEAGRALNATKLRAQQLSSGNPQFIKQALKRGLRVDQIIEILKRTDPSDIEARTKMLIKFGDNRGTWQRINHALGTYYISNILSGLKPTEHNILGNSINMAMKLALTPPAALADRLDVAAQNAWARARGRAPTAERQIYAGEPFKELIAGWQGIGDAARKFTYIMKNGFTPEEGMKFDMPFELFSRAHPAVRAAANIIPRFMSAQDAFFRVLSQQMEHSGLAYTAARNQAFRENAAGQLPEGQSFRDRFTDLYKLFNDHPTPEMQKQIDLMGARGVYQERNQLSNSLAKIREIGGIGVQAVMPFIHTGLNIERRGMQLTPLGLAMPGTYERTRIGRFRQAETGLGTLATGVGIALVPWVQKAMNGEITGHGPTDPAERDAWYREGHQPNSISLKGPDGQMHPVSFDQLGPLAFPLELIGNYADELRDLEKKGQVPQEHIDALAGHVLTQTLHSIGDQTFFKGPKEFFEMLDDFDRHGWRFISSIAQGFVPASGFLRGVSTYQDPTLRKPTSVGEAVKEVIPETPLTPSGYSYKSVQPKITALGEPARSQQVGGGVGRMALPVNITTIHDDPVLRESARIGLKINLPSAKLTGQELSKEETTTLQQAKGYAVRDALKELYADPGWKELDPEDQLAEAKSAVSSARKAVADQARMLKEDKTPWTLENLNPNAP